ncbi:hypothetical protein EC957_011872 [Mortierella hygrophila]|uniref:Uncharacterized protein n=1 Tax=Mortierella hygrophila TaxID=979708 RepID=A0A9P6F826_9FUNG|nr:hypothetical protein EC957_011872 [Mortierella hygrophila]
MFNALFLKLLNFQHHGELPLSLLVRHVYEDTKDRLVEHGRLPKIKDDTRLLVVHNEAQVLRDEFNGSFQSATSVESPRPLLSPILHPFRDIGQHQLSLITCGTGLSINTLFWIQSSGSGLKDSSTNFERDWNDALSTVSAAKIECPDNVYISMIVAYPTKWTDKLPAPSELPKDPSGVQQVVINVSDDNFGDIIPKEHVEFTDRLKNARKRC